MKGYQFIDDYGSFELESAENDRELYFPLAGENGLKSSVTPNLGGDSKLDQNHFLLEPVSAVDLRNSRSTRNFWCIQNGSQVWSAAGASAKQEAMRFGIEQEPSKVRAGMMWHEICRESKEYGMKADILTFVPIQCNVEVMFVTITNTGKEAMEVTGVAAVPIYGRSADNIRDHRHVTSLLHRSVTTTYGVHVSPTLSFDERGHQLNDITYFVEGMTGDGQAPESFYPELEAFTGAAGTLQMPEALICNKPGVGVGVHTDGQEILGGIRFAPVTLAVGESAEYIVLAGALRQESQIEGLRENLMDSRHVRESLELTRQYWIRKINVHYDTGDENFDQFMNWVSFQPELRRIFGCSFLPHHDYGKGGRGWRDLWQDCLALLMMHPEGVRQMLVSSFGGVRVDGSNATIIGEQLGEFKADRNSITRVWMDHGVWPLITTKLYIDQTGDFEILYEKMPYFKDRQVMRGTMIDKLWDPETKWQEDGRRRCYEGTILEHLLIQNLTAFYEVGEHNCIRLRDADWNDAIDMAGERGESVAFTSAYAMNLSNLALLLEREYANGVQEIELLEELQILLADDEELYRSVAAKNELLRTYMKACVHTVSGTTIWVDIMQVAASLKHKADWLVKHIREQEWVSDGRGNGWFNSYYDNHGNPVEGVDENGNVRMMLTGQVFAIMAQTATDEQVQTITRAADTYLYDEDCGGYRLNTDFHELKTDMGRMFGFAYGEKENGAVFSHMAVMYANALYGRGFAAEGYKVLDALYRQSMNFEKSRIYPGIPEYFGKDGRGMYHYLTGAASWYMLTVITQMFGIRGDGGDMTICPKLLKCQFNEQHQAQITLRFFGMSWRIKIENPQDLEVGDYEIAAIRLDDRLEEVGSRSKTYGREYLKTLDARKLHRISVILGKIINETERQGRAYEQTDRDISNE